MEDVSSSPDDPEPEPDPAIEAFARLEASVSGMDQRQDARLSMLTRAVEHIAMERQSVEIPDYNPSLARLNGHQTVLAKEMKSLTDAPAMQLTPEDMAQRIADAARAARETDQAAIEKAQALHREAHADLVRVTGTVRTKHEQRRHMLWTGIGTALAVSLLWLVYPGWAAGVAPQDWLWPERVARRTRGEASLWDAGIRLMRVGNPEGWRAIVNAADIARENRAVIIVGVDGPRRHRIVPE